MEQAHAVTKALVLHSEEALLIPMICAAEILICLLWMDMRRGDNGEDLKVNWSARGGETAGEVEGGGGEFERGELLWVACNSTKFFSSHS